MTIDPGWISAIVALLTFLGAIFIGILKIAIDIGKNTQITQQVLSNQKTHGDEIQGVKQDVKHLEGRFIALETKHNVHVAANHH